MEKPTLRDVQLVELYIAKEIKRICQKHNIQYFMSDGTLLGAVRHQGFIPWDDDMDFGMPLTDYNKFLSIANEELSDDFFLQHVTTDPGYIMPYAKVRLNGTKICEAVSADSEMHCGIWVDIFPFVTMDEKTLCSPGFFKKAKLLMAMYLQKNGYNLNAVTQNPIKRFVKSVLKYMPISKTYLRECVFGVLDNEPKTGAYCMEVGDALGDELVYPKCWFDEFVELRFEDDAFPAPAHYEKVLTKEYGNYMVLPEEAKRKSHAVINVEIENAVLQKVKENLEIA